MNNPEELHKQFVARTLPKAAWTHEAHLKVGLTYLYHYPKEEALCYMRSGIITYNIAVGTENTPQGGYHETLTVFWIEVLDAFKQNHAAYPLTELCQAFLQSTWARRDLALQYYSRERLFSILARSRWIEPDLAPFDFGPFS